MSPLAFLKRPVNWLRAMQRYNARITGAPNFALSVCTTRIPEEDLEGLNLSSLVLCFTGAETCRHDTIEAFYKRFCPLGLARDVVCPAYGLAEATLMVSVKPPHSKTPRTLWFHRDRLRGNVVVQVPETHASAVPYVSCGKPVQSLKLWHRQQGAWLDEGCAQVGEICVKGPRYRQCDACYPSLLLPRLNLLTPGWRSVSPGYWNDVEPGGNSGSPDGWLRTGDAGFLVNGEVFVCGRLKDVIVLRGKNIYPQVCAQVPDTGTLR